MFLLKPYLHCLGWSQEVSGKYRGKPGPKSFIQTTFNPVLFVQPRQQLMMMRVKMKITTKTVLLMMRVRRRKRWMKTRTTYPNQTTVAKRTLNVCRKKQKCSSGGRSDFGLGYFPWKPLLHTNLTTIKHLILSKEAFYKVFVLDYFHGFYLHFLRNS